MKIRIGYQPVIVINLPSKKPGNGSIYVGKVTANLNGLKSSQRLNFDRGSLLSFGEDLERMDATLKGCTLLLSCCKSFELSMKMTALGHVTTRYRMSTSQFSQPTNIEWTAVGEFSFEPSKLKSIVREIDVKS